MLDQEFSELLCRLPRLRELDELELLYHAMMIGLLGGIWISLYGGRTIEKHI